MESVGGRNNLQISKFITLNGIYLEEENFKNKNKLKDTCPLRCRTWCDTLPSKHERRRSLKRHVKMLWRNTSYPDWYCNEFTDKGVMYHWYWQSLEFGFNSGHFNRLFSFFETDAFMIFHGGYSIPITPPKKPTFLAICSKTFWNERVNGLCYFGDYITQIHFIVQTMTYLRAQL